MHCISNLYLAPLYLFMAIFHKNLTDKTGWLVLGLFIVTWGRIKSATLQKHVYKLNEKSQKVNLT